MVAYYPGNARADLVDRWFRVICAAVFLPQRDAVPVVTRAG
jgi:hypothetical protein